MVCPGSKRGYRSSTNGGDDQLYAQERRNPDLISGSRNDASRWDPAIAIQDLNRLLKQHKQMQKMMKKMKGGGMQRMMRGLVVWVVPVAVCRGRGADRQKGGHTAPFLAMLFAVSSALFLRGSGHLAPLNEFEDMTVW